MNTDNKATDWQDNSDTAEEMDWADIMEMELPPVLEVEITDSENVSLVRYNKDHNAIDFHNDEGLVDYSIGLDEAETLYGYLDWVFHLSEKSWCTPQTLHAFITITSSLMHAAGTSPFVCYAKRTSKGFSYKKGEAK